MQNNIFRYGRHYVRLNGDTLEWSDSPYGGWKFKQNRWRTSALNSNEDVYLILQYSDEELLAFTDRGIFSSKDGCQSWKQILTGFDHERVNLNDLHVEGRNIISVVGNNVYYSDDHGLSWHPKRR